MLGGAYILCELDGSILDHPTATFRLIPYLARVAIDLPENFADITPERLHGMHLACETTEDNERGPDSDDEDSELHNDGDEPALDP